MVWTWLSNRWKCWISLTYFTIVKLFILVSQERFLTPSSRRAMHSSIASNYDLKFIVVGVVGRGMVRVSRSILAISIAIKGSLLSYPLVKLALANGILFVLLRLALLIGELGWVSSLHARFYHCNTFMALFGHDAIFYFLKQVPLESLSSLNSCVSSSSSSLSILFLKDLILLWETWASPSICLVLWNLWYSRRA